MEQGNWDGLDQALPLELLSRFTEMSRAVLGDNLVGVYLHGSAAMGCYNPEKSDLDLLLVVNDPVPDGVKREFMENAVRLNREAPRKGFEWSMVRREFCKPFAYPTPFELHFSNAHLEWFQQKPDDYIQRMKGDDWDLAAHFTVINRCGRTLYGEKISEVFGEVPEDAYIDSILRDVSEAVSEIESDPVYITLNLCRVLAYLRDGQVLSKKAGGEWGLQYLPRKYHPLIKGALKQYTRNAQTPARPEAVGFARYMLQNIAMEIPF